jgi:4-hydroxybenzoate polyprenyltransferase
METGSLKNTFKMIGPIAWLALAAGLQMIGALLFFKAPIDLILIFTGITITFGVYMLNKFTDDEDNYNCPDQKMFFQKKSLLIASPILLIVSSIFLLVITNRLVAWHIILIVSGILYSISVIPFVRNKSLCFIRLKNILFIKNIVVCLLWGITPFALAASQKYSVMPGKTDLLIAVIAFCLTTFITAIAYDVPDADGDRHVGVLTITTQFGEKFTAYFLLITGIIGCFCVGIFYLMGIIKLPVTILFYANILWTGIVTIPAFIKTTPILKSYIKPLLDSQCVFCGLSLIVFSYILRP